jgi:hypothetical protein
MRKKEHARAMLPFLHYAERDDWHHLVISDELWMFFNSFLCRMWTLPRDDIVTKPKLDIQICDYANRSSGDSEILSNLVNCMITTEPKLNPRNPGSKEFLQVASGCSLSGDEETPPKVGNN